MIRVPFAFPAGADSQSKLPGFGVRHDPFFASTDRSPIAAQGLHRHRGISGALEERDYEIPPSFDFACNTGHFFSISCCVWMALF